MNFVTGGEERKHSRRRKGFERESWGAYLTGVSEGGICIAFDRGSGIVKDGSLHGSGTPPHKNAEASNQSKMSVKGSNR